MLGHTTSYGGSIIRNIVLDIPVSNIWERQTLFVVLVTRTTILFVKRNWIHHWNRWGYFFDSIGLASFAPLALREEIHAVLTFFCGLSIWVGWKARLNCQLLLS
ncbi:hypothetical protein ACE1MS_13285 [Lysinibacillus sp. fkY74-1]|uniref:hypothetical protein n=1 Tax=Lysinibacillus TaxID=400634 RepID=UPI001F3AE670|nr:hypothetical protein [Lysinibacillus sphaericus]MEB7453398.1 hypothetical protein [Lysinibacillus sphaericus]